MSISGFAKPKWAALRRPSLSLMTMTATALMAFGAGIYYGTATDSGILPIALPLIGYAIFAIEMLIGRQGTPDLEGLWPSLPHQKEVDLVRSEGLRVFAPHFLMVELEAGPNGEVMGGELQVALRTLRVEGGYIVTGPEGITKDRFVEVIDEPTRRRRQIRRINR